MSTEWHLPSQLKSGLYFYTSRLTRMFYVTVNKLFNVVIDDNMFLSAKHLRGERQQGAQSHVPDRWSEFESVESNKGEIILLG